MSEYDDRVNELLFEAGRLLTYSEVDLEDRLDAVDSETSEDHEEMDRHRLESTRRWQVKFTEHLHTNYPTPYTGVPMLRRGVAYLTQGAIALLGAAAFGHWMGAVITALLIVIADTLRGIET